MHLGVVSTPPHLGHGFVFHCFDLVVVHQAGCRVRQRHAIKFKKAWRKLGEINKIRFTLDLFIEALQSRLALDLGALHLGALVPGALGL